VCSRCDECDLPKPVSKNLGFSPTRSFCVIDLARNSIAGYNNILHHTICRHTGNGAWTLYWPLRHIFYRSGRRAKRITEINEKNKKPEETLFFLPRTVVVYINTRRSLYYDVYFILTCTVDAMKSSHNITKYIRNGYIYYIYYNIISCSYT